MADPSSGTPAFRVTFSPEAKRAIYAEADGRKMEKPGVMIHRQGPNADVTRKTDGQVAWTVERPHPWRARTYDFAVLGDDTTDISIQDGVLVWLALVPRPEEVGVHVSLREGALHVEPQGAA